MGPNICDVREFWHEPGGFSPTLVMKRMMLCISSDACTTQHYTYPVKKKRENWKNLWGPGWVTSSSGTLGSGKELPLRIIRVCMLHCFFFYVWGYRSTLIKGWYSHFYFILKSVKAGKKLRYEVKKKKKKKNSGISFFLCHLVWNISSAIIISMLMLSKGTGLV